MTAVAVTPHNVLHPGMVAAAILLGVAVGVVAACWQYLGQLPDPTDW